MHVVVVGATGNVGTAVLRLLERTDEIDSVLGVARRVPAAPGQNTDPQWSKVRWHAADVSTDPLDFVSGADAVIHLAWRIQPSRDESALRATNVEGTARLVDAVGSHGAGALVYASSVGTYAPGPKSPPADESWPATGIDTSFYSRHKALVEADLDRVGEVHPDMRVVRMRTSLVFQRSAASEIHRLFLGRLMPWHLPRALRAVPRTAGLVFQATHADDIADAYVRAVLRDVSGPFNVAAGPTLTPRLIAEAVGGRTVPVPPQLLRAAVAASYVARLQVSEPGWLDMALQTPVMDTARAEAELGWRPRHTSIDALTELLDGIGAKAAGPTPALER
jgi:nucleoside-diphosphate-sugar epimerase